NDGRLIAINAENGKLCETFANKGVLNLQSNMPDTKPGQSVVDVAVPSSRHSSAE
ncbi:hypothetical protein DD593_27655, partial [Enterobacter cloacae complex sp. 742-ADZ3-9B]